MKQIVVLSGIENTESDWCRILSHEARVVLIQRGNIERAEIWERGNRIVHIPDRPIPKTTLYNMPIRDVCAMASYFRWIRRLAPGRIDLMVTPSMHCGAVAWLLQVLGKAKKHVCFINDYFPPQGSLLVRIWRRLHARNTRFHARRASQVWAVSPRIPAAQENPNSHVIPLFIDRKEPPAGERADIVYLGYPTEDHALDLLFAVARKHGIRVHIIGTSGLLSSLKEHAPENTVFHGFLRDREQIATILRQCFCGYAVYRNTGPASYSYYGVPSKLFYYLANEVPIVTTDTAHFSQTIADRKLGKLVRPVLEDIEPAILEIRAQPDAYRRSIRDFSESWNLGVEDFLHARLRELL